jgi:hydroxyacylglutathione hydrolase
MEVLRIGGGPWNQNCFLVIKENSSVLIDPGGNALGILDVIRSRNLNLLAILNTHGHFDHIGAVHEVVNETSSPFFISGKEKPIMRSSNMLRYIFKHKEKISIPSQFEDLDDCNFDLSFNNLHFRLIRTPGHTPGGFCFVIENHIFTGDTVLSSMPGSAELPGGNVDDLRASLIALASLDGDLTAHLGHGRDTKLSQALTLSQNWLNAGSN